MSGSAVRIGVGTRFQYDGEMVTVVELIITLWGARTLQPHADLR